MIVNAAVCVISSGKKGGIFKNRNAFIGIQERQSDQTGESQEELLRGTQTIHSIVRVLVMKLAQALH